MSDHWQLIAAVDWTKRDLASLFSEDPNTVLWNSTNTDDDRLDVQGIGKLRVQTWPVGRRLLHRLEG